jgi:hypothetical protein
MGDEPLALPRVSILDPAAHRFEGFWSPPRAPVRLNEGDFTAAGLVESLHLHAVVEVRKRDGTLMRYTATPVHEHNLETALTGPVPMGGAAIG